MGNTLYGIANCDQVKKARGWLDAHHCPFQFHDVRKAGLDRSLIESWLQHVSWQTLVNRKGTTWRALSDDYQASIVDADSAIVLMLAAPAVIKRPVLVTPTTAVVGFSDHLYQQIFKN